jgi:nitroreductase
MIYEIRLAAPSPQPVTGQAKELSMDRRTFLASTMVVAASTAFPGVASTKSQDITLPPPQTSGGKPLMEVLKARCSTRAYSPKPLEPQVLSDLLWAAWGQSRPDGKRTAPSWKNRQEISVYAILAEGLYRYDAKSHSLKLMSEKNLRPLAGKQDFAATAPLNLVYVLDTAKMSEAPPEERLLYGGCDSGSIFQNVYLYCASQGLVTVVRANVDKPALAKEMGLGADQLITVTQSVGYPKS